MHRCTCMGKCTGRKNRTEQNTARKPPHAYCNLLSAPIISLAPNQLHPTTLVTELGFGYFGLRTLSLLAGEVPEAKNLSALTFPSRPHKLILFSWGFNMILQPVFVACISLKTAQWCAKIVPKIQSLSHEKEGLIESCGRQYLGPSVQSF